MSADALTEPAARLWSPPSTSGIAPSSSEASAVSIQPLADVGDVADVLLPFVGPFLRLRNRRRQIAFVDDREAERGEVLAEAGDAKRRRPHVHAAAVAAEIERHADHMDGDHRSFTDTDMPSVPGFTIDVKSAGMMLDRIEEIAHLALFVDDVVREEEAARAQTREDEIEEPLVVGLPRVEKHEIERAGQPSESP